MERPCGSALMISPTNGLKMNQSAMKESQFLRGASDKDDGAGGPTQQPPAASHPSLRAGRPAHVGSRGPCLLPGLVLAATTARGPRTGCPGTMRQTRRKKKEMLFF